MASKNAIFIQWARIFPFLNWLSELKHQSTLKQDTIAGITVALLFIPQSMAYAKLAGLPAYYGLYASFIPTIIASLFGSSRLLSTAPIALTSMLTGTFLQAFAVSGTDEYLQFVFMFTLMAGLIQLFLGFLHLGVIINFLSHPVLQGFINAAALFIASAQLSSIFGLTLVDAPHYYASFLQTFQNIQDVHWPTFYIAMIALGIMIVGKNRWPNSPYILFALMVTTTLSWYSGFDKTTKIKLAQIQSMGLQQLILDYQKAPLDLEGQFKKIANAQSLLNKLVKEKGETAQVSIDAFQNLSQEKWQLERMMARQKEDKNQLFHTKLVQVEIAHGKHRYFLDGQSFLSKDANPKIWRIDNIDAQGNVTLQAGGKIVGAIPRGLPKFERMAINWEQAPRLLVAAIIISLLGFIEAITIAKRIATHNREQLDVNQELIGQGLAKAVGSFFQSMPVAGGFSRSTINYEVGAKTGFSSVVAGLTVMGVLLWFTDLFYFVPEATLAAVIIVSVLGLIDFKAMFMTWKVSYSEGIVAWTTFILTLVMAPRLEIALLMGMVLSLGVYLHETMHPRFSELLRAEDGDLIEFEIETVDSSCAQASLIRFGGSLYFANVAYFEDRVIALLALKPKLDYLILDCARINKLDASGLESFYKIAERLESSGIALWFTRVTYPVMQIFKRSGFYEKMGPQFFFKHNEDAIAMLAKKLGPRHMRNCPLAKSML